MQPDNHDSYSSPIVLAVALNLSFTDSFDGRVIDSSFGQLIGPLVLEVGYRPGRLWLASRETS
jgi:hypothetical protein